MDKFIKVRCSYTEMISPIDVDKFEPTQGNLKELDGLNYQKLRNEIVRLGFTSPVYLYEDLKTGRTMKVIDGHQRIKTVSKMMKEEGFKFEGIPVIYVKADSLAQAMEMLLGFVSQYGHVTMDGLVQFMEDQKFQIDDIEKRFSLPALNLNDLRRRLSLDEIIRDTASPQYPIVPKFQESYDGVVVFCTNEMDYISLKNILGLKNGKSYKNEAVWEMRVLSFNDLMKAFERYYSNLLKKVQ